MAAASHAGLFEIIPVGVRQHLPDQLALRENIETDRYFGVVQILCPASDTIRRDQIDETVYGADLRAAVNPGMPGDTAANSFHFVAVLQSWGAITCRGVLAFRIKSRVIMRVVGHAAV